MGEYLELAEQIARIVMMLFSGASLFFAERKWTSGDKIDALWLLGISIWLISASS